LRGVQRMHASVAHAPRRVRCESGSSIKFASVCIVDSATKRGLLLLARTALLVPDAVHSAGTAERVSIRERIPVAPLDAPHRADDPAMSRGCADPHAFLHAGYGRIRG